MPEREHKVTVHKGINQIPKYKICKESERFEKDPNRTSRNEKYNWH